MKLIDKERFVIPGKTRYTIETIEDLEVIEAIPISWLTSKGMTMISNDARTELFKLIRAWSEEQEERE